MTFQEFKKQVGDKTLFEKAWYYLLCIAVIVMGLLCLFGSFGESTKSSPLLYVLVFFLCLLGAIGIYLLPGRYKIFTIDSDLLISQKEVIGKKLIEETGYLPTHYSRQYVTFLLKQKWWQSLYKVHLFHDDDRFAIVLYCVNYKTGFIDFGGTDKKRKMIVRLIKDIILDNKKKGDCFQSP